MHEPERRKEANCAGCKHNGKSHEERIAKVECGGDGPTQALEVEYQVMDRVEEDVNGNRGRGEERFPPPSPVLHTEVHVSQD